MGGPRYPPGPRPGVRMPQMGGDFNGVSIYSISLSCSWKDVLLLQS